MQGFSALRLVFVKFILVLAGLAVFCQFIGTAYAQRAGLSIIRDEEIETYLGEWAEPVIRAAGMTPEQVNIILVQSPEVNAFVAGGANIFIYTGLITKTENPGELVSVIAHELGHIAGGHLTRTRDMQTQASFETLLGTLLGVGAAIATGDGGAAAAGAQIGQSSAMNSFMAFSRVQESSADQAGFRFIESANLNPSGTVSFLQKIASEELLPTSQQSQFMRTHPLSQQRIEALKNKVDNSPLRSKPTPAQWDDQYKRMKAKLAGFVTPQQVTYQYKSQDTGVPSLYARSIAAYRQSRIQEALTLNDQLLAKEPNNPYFLELKGQILYETGKIADSLPFYEKAIKVKPSSGLIRIAYAQSLLDTAGKSPAALQKAIDELKRAQIDEPRTTRVKRLLATAYGRKGEEVKARVYLAEEALMQGRKSQAASMAKSALTQLPPGSPEYIRAQDVISSVDE